jgi:hypothetical protein
VDCDCFDLRALAEAVERHQLGSDELPSYLAGLAATPELLDLAAELQGERLSPKQLASRLKEMLE